MYLYEVWGPCDTNCYLELTSVEAKRKTEALSCYQSQLESVDYLDIIEHINTIRVNEIYNILNTSFENKTTVECFEYVDNQKLKSYIKENGFINN